MDRVNITKMPTWEVRVRGALGKFSAAESSVAEYVLSAPEVVFGSSVRELAEKSGVSEASVVRFLRHAGFAGLKELKAAMAQGRRFDRDAASESRRLSESDTIRAIGKKVFGGCIEALEDTLNVLDERELAVAIDALYSAPYVEVFGVGGSASVARSALHSFRRIGLRMDVTTDFTVTYLNKERFNAGDVVLAISCSGETPEILKAVDIAKRKGAFIISITNLRDSSLARMSNCRLRSTCRTHMLPDDETYERVAQIAIIHALYAGVAMRQEKRTEL